MLSPPGQLAAAELAIYLIVVFPCVYSLYTHGKYGILSWFFILAFCMLRIIGSGLLISDEKHNSTSQTTQIISGVGLSPLIMGVLGVLTEANHYLPERRSWMLRWPMEVALHATVGAGLALVVVGIKKGGAITKVGYVLFVIVWLAAIGLTALSWASRNRGVDSKRLLIAITFALPFLGIRILYALISQFDKEINAYSGPIAYRVVLAALMEFFVVIILVTFGVLTRNVRVEEPNLERKGSKESAGSV